MPFLFCSSKVFFWGGGEEPETEAEPEMEAESEREAEPETEAEPEREAESEREKARVLGIGRRNIIKVIRRSIKLL